MLITRIFIIQNKNQKNIHNQQIGGQKKNLKKKQKS